MMKDNIELAGIFGDTNFLVVMASDLT